MESIRGTSGMGEAHSAAAAYMAAWNAIRQPELDKKNPRFGNRYASLLSMQNAIRKACSGLGIVYRQSTQVAPEGVFLVSEVMGEGERIELSRYPLTVTANDQDNGRNLTYAKRQQCGVDWGICGDEDDDGNAQAPQGRKASPARIRRREPPSDSKDMATAAMEEARAATADALTAAKRRAADAMRAYCERNEADYGAELEEFKERMALHTEDPSWFEAQASFYEAN